MSRCRRRCRCPRCRRRRGVRRPFRGRGCRGFRLLQRGSGGRRGGGRGQICKILRVGGGALLPKLGRHRVEERRRSWGWIGVGWVGRVLGWNRGSRGRIELWQWTRLSREGKGQAGGGGREGKSGCGCPFLMGGVGGTVNVFNYR